MTNECGVIETIDCVHIMTETDLNPERHIISIGNNRVVRLCDGCWAKIANDVVQSIISMPMLKSFKPKWRPLDKTE